MNGFPSFDLTGRIALVTGAARGIGNAISQAPANAVLGAEAAFPTWAPTITSGLISIHEQARLAMEENS